MRLAEYNSRYFRCLSRLWNFNSVDGRIITAARRIWRGLRNSDQKPNRNQSSVERLGARIRERLIIRSCCFMSRLSATMVLAPPGPRSLTVVVSKWARSISRYFMEEQGREVSHQEQDCPSCPFQVKITNSPETGGWADCDAGIQVKATSSRRSTADRWRGHQQGDGFNGGKEGLCSLYSPLSHGA